MSDTDKMLGEVTAREEWLASKWHKPVKEIYNVYEGAKHAETPFNILYSNTEVLVPNLFSAAPKPIVRKRFGELRADAAAKAAERMVEYEMDTNLSGYPDFVEAIGAAVLDAALPGQGQCRVRVVEEKVCTDYVQHDAYIWGYAKRWEDTPWIAYRMDKTLEDIFNTFKTPPEVRALVEIARNTAGTTDGEGKPSTHAIYEVWNKANRKVFFLCDLFPEKHVQTLDDPLRLSGFFPSGKPLRLIETPCSTLPRPLYHLYRQQALELNLITQRITRITEAIQVRGIYDGGIPELEQVFDTSGTAENKLIPTNNPGGMMRDGGLDKHIWLVPVEKLVQTLQTLYQVRDQIKATIYEILGIGDILRGVTKASETASAQEIKDKWGTLRIKKSREKVSSFVRWHIRAMIELSAEHLPEKVWADATGLDYTPSLEAGIASEIMGAPQDPEKPKWSQVLDALKNDLKRSYIVDIETNSTVDGDATEEKRDAIDFMNALGQAMPVMEGLGSQGPEGFKAAQILLVEICKKYRLGSEIQSAVMQMVPQAGKMTPEQEEQQKAMDQQKQELDQQAEQIKQQAEQATQAEGQIKEMGAQLKEQIFSAKEQLGGENDRIKDAQRAVDDAAKDLEHQKAELDLARRELELEKQAFELQMTQKQVEFAGVKQQAQGEMQQKELGLQQSVVQHESKKVQEGAKEADSKTDSIGEVLTLLKSQTETVTKLIDTMMRPVIITKTGEGKFEKKLG